MATRKIEVAITGDSRLLERAFSRSGKAADSFGKKVNGGVGRSLAGLARAGAAASVALGVGAVYGMKKAVDAASDLQESVSKTNVVFGKNAKEVMAWSKTSVTAMGQSQQQALEAASTYGNLFQAFGVGLKPATQMSTTLTQLASDLASFNNTGVEEAIQALRSGLSGETEPLKRYGIAINDARLKNEALKLGLISTTKDALTPAAKAQAAYALVMKDSKLAQGDFARTSDGLANSQRILRASFENVKATLGTALIPVVTRAMNAVGDFLDKFNQAPTLRAKLSVVIDAFEGIAWRGWQTVVSWWNGTQKPLDLMIRPKVESGRDLTNRIINTYQDEISKAATRLGSRFADVFDRSAGTSGAGMAGRIIKAWAIEFFVPWESSGYKAAESFVTGFVSRITQGLRERVADAIRGALDSVTGSLKGAANNLAGAVTAGGPTNRATRRGRDDAKQYVADFKLTVTQLGAPLFDGVEKAATAAQRRIKASLTQILNEAVASARGNLSSLTSGLAGMLSRINSARIANMTSGETLTSGKKLSEIRKEQARVLREREKARLENAVSEAKTDEERRQAEQDLNDWKIEDEARILEEQMAEREKAYDEDIENLTTSFNRGLISAEAFQAELSKIIGGDTGAELGTEFATMFSQQLTAVIQQIQALAGFANIATGAPGAENPQTSVVGAAGETNQERFQKAWDRWNDRRAARRKALEDATELNAKGKRVKRYTPQEVDRLMAKWREENPEPKRSAFGLAKGGVLKKQVFTAGERGPEAVIPLDSGRAQRLLAEAVGGGAVTGGNTIINVTVNGNEFSAREFADKLAPELRRRVTMLRSA